MAVIIVAGYVLLSANVKDAMSEYYQQETDTETVSGFISKCIDDVTVIKTVKMWANQKPWLAGEMCALLRARDAAFRSGNSVAYRITRNNLRKGIREVKGLYGKRLGKHLTAKKDTQRLWQGVPNSNRLQAHSADSL